MSEMQNNIASELKNELKDDPAFDETILVQKIKSAMRELRMRRSYPDSYIEDDVTKDMENYYSTIMNVARFDYNQRGVEGESTHTEKGISRTYADREKLWMGVHAFVKVF